MEYEEFELLLHVLLDLWYMSACDQQGCFTPSEKVPKHLK